MSSLREFTPDEWNRLGAELVQTARESVRLGIMTQREAEMWLNQFRQVSVNQRPRAYLRHRYRNVDALLASGQISQDRAEELRRAIIDEAHDRGLGDPPW